MESLSRISRIKQEDVLVLKLEKEKEKMTKQEGNIGTVFCQACEWLTFPGDLPFCNGFHPKTYASGITLLAC